MGNLKSKFVNKYKFNEEFVKNVKKIQRAYRRYIRRLHDREMQAMEILQKLQYVHENESAQTLAFFNELTHKLKREFVRAIPRESILMRHTRLSTKILMLDDRYNEGYFNYKVTPINFPLTDIEFTKILDCICRKTDNLLPPQCVLHVLRMAAQSLRKLDNVNVIRLQKKMHVTICGPLNGNLRNLIMVFYKNGIPSKDNPYVFNGDFVDNGENSVEVLILILACYLSYPHAIYLNRGNHEDSLMNSRFGFADELQRKYGHFSLKLFNLIDEIWRNLPLATVVNDRVFIVHGGISSTTNLGFVYTLDRSKYASLLRPATDSVDREEWEQILNIIWSNDQSDRGADIERYAGCSFTEEDTTEFLRKHQFSLLISSNTPVLKGYEYRQNNKLLILSAASNIFSENISGSAFVVLNHLLKPRIIDMKTKIGNLIVEDLDKRVESLERIAVEELKIHLFNKYNELEEAFHRVGPQATGYIRVSEWYKSIEKVCRLNIQWHHYYNELNETNKKGYRMTRLSDTVPYTATLNVIKSDVVRYNNNERTSLVDALYKNTRTLEVIFFLIDNGRTGSISIEDFQLACDVLQKHIPGVNKNNLLRMYNLLDVKKQGSLALSDFFQIFALCEKYSNVEENVISIDEPNIENNA